MPPAAMLPLALLLALTSKAIAVAAVEGRGERKGARAARSAADGGGGEEEEEEEEGLFKADAVNEEDPERDRATQV